MKAKAFQLISYIVQSEGTTIKNGLIIDNLSKIVNLTITSLEFVINNKLEYISSMGKDRDDYPDYGYDNLLFQMLLFLSRFLAREPIITGFTGFVKKYFIINS